jgi:Zn-dependent peptidase ImmA (M78 family)
MRKDAIERKAQLLLRQYGNDEIPVDVDLIAKRLKIEVTETELPDETSGVIQKVDNGHSTILANSRHAKVRQRFTIAHELGHFLLSTKSGIFVDKKIYFRDSRSQPASDPEEIVANIFAAELLMPTQHVKRELHRLTSGGIIDIEEDIIALLAKRFEVSLIAMSIKLQNMGLSF